ncbi:hypothetical protein O3P69_001802 [Scylla paramamosain]|uniref:Uncharacterized protein n=1 Tax=Scylla paramamosain TaxID=85552 RepID=A0AAW0V217_SCYPA
MQGEGSDDGGDGRPGIHPPPQPRPHPPLSFPATMTSPASLRPLLTLLILLTLIFESAVGVDGGVEAGIGSAGGKAGGGKGRGIEVELGVVRVVCEEAANMVWRGGLEWWRTKRSEAVSGDGMDGMLTSVVVM